MAIKRRSRRKPAAVFKDRLVSFANRAREAASRLPDGAERSVLTERDLCARIALQVHEWVNSLEQHPPKQAAASRHR